MDEKLDELICCVADLKQLHGQSQKDLDGKLKKLEDDFTAMQKDVTKIALKKAWREPPNEFCRKGHEEQFVFNAELGDQINAVARRMSKLGPTLEKDKATVQQAMSELKEDMDMIAERQKHIWIADQSEHGGHVQGKQCGG